ncbi:MAG: prenyltransferase [Planctomycetota bacterium]|nr:MAG: prenyltransferase [Planctomycetota bacterium]
MILFSLVLLLPQTDSDASVLSNEGRAAAERGLQWLAAHQLADGSWTGDVGYKLQDGYEVWQRNSEHVGVTALAGMAFLAGGHVPDRGPYGPVVARAADFILQHVQDNGYISFNETRMYSHAFATLFLAEMHGMTARRDVREALQKAVNLIVGSQNQEGGWRYQPNVADADMSVTVCQVVALRAARNIGIQVPASTIDRAVSYVKRSAVREDEPRSHWTPNPVGSFRYQPTSDSRASFALTAAGIVTLHGAGVYADEDIERGLEYLESDLRNFSHETGIAAGGHYFFYYGHYYAVQAFHMAGGRRYRNYFESVEQTLLRMQKDDGSWPNNVGPGRAFGTAVACLILQIPREYLPIFQR